MPGLMGALIVLAVLALGGWGYGVYAARPVRTADGVVPAADPSPLLHVVGAFGVLMLLVRFIVWSLR